MHLPGKCARGIESSSEADVEYSMGLELGQALGQLLDFLFK